MNDVATSPIALPQKARCAHCQKEFTESKYNRRRQKFCCRRCHKNSYERKRRREAKANGIACRCCGCLFCPLNANTRFCSQECRIQSRLPVNRNRLRDDRLKNPGRFKEYSRRSYARTASDPDRRKRRLEYYRTWTQSNRQRTREYSRRHAERRGNVERQCSFCGGLFRSKTKAMYCSLSCAAIATAERSRSRNTEADCDKCGTPFIPSQRTQRFCSQRCQLAAYRDRVSSASLALQHLAIANLTGSFRG